ncbi:MAG: PD-(D/E)XK nuclease family protein, partial [Bacteroidaceae bacterium]|nr:PD-(D/E)XK nuclease family protein [Bacteroidaceae bacterium]
MSLYFFNYETARTDNERKLSAEQLLTIFNRNIVKNAELLDYLDKKNIFGIISKSRNENTHSRFVAELLSGTFFNGDSRESTLLHFLDIILYRAGKENKVAEVDEHLRRAILTRSVMFERVETECELSVRKYQKEYSKFTTQASAEKDDRLDIYLKF